jgi:hypothetical protein
MSRRILAVAVLAQCLSAGPATSHEGHSHHDDVAGAPTSAGAVAQLPPQDNLEWIRYTHGLIAAIAPHGSARHVQASHELQRRLVELRDGPRDQVPTRLAELRTAVGDRLREIAALVIDVSDPSAVPRISGAFRTRGGHERPVIVAVVNRSDAPRMISIASQADGAVTLFGTEATIAPRSTAGLVLQLRAEPGQFEVPLSVRVDDRPARGSLTVESLAEAALHLSVEGEPVRGRVIGSDGWFCQPQSLVTYPAGTAAAPDPPPDDALTRPITLGGSDFYIAGPATITVPAGLTRLIASRGPFHFDDEQSVDVRPGMESRVTLAPQRWIDPLDHGRISADVHVHVRRTWAWDAVLGVILRGEDLHIMEALVLSNPRGAWAVQDAFGDDSRLTIAPHRLLSSGQEFRNARWGHVDLLGHRSLIEPLSTGPALTGSQLADYPANATVIRQARELGGIAVIAHGGNLGLEGVADLILGECRVMEVLQFGDFTGLDLWYDLLSAGFHVAPAAGTDYPVGNLPGVERVVVAPDGEGYRGWLGGLERGRSFVTNGPWIELSVNGQPPGAVIEASAGDVLEIEARVHSGLRDGAMDPVVLIGGRPIDGRIESQGPYRTWRGQWRVDGPTWIAARTEHRGEFAHRLAHTAAVMIKTAGQPPRDAAAVDRLRERLARLIATAQREARFDDAAQKSRVLEIFTTAQGKLAAP